MDTFNSNSRGSRASDAKLTNVTKKQIRRKLLQRSSCASKPVPAKAERWDSHGKTKGLRPSTRNLCLFPRNRTHWVAYNQVSPFLADTPKDRKGWANTSKPQVRTQTQLSRVGSQGTGIYSAANTGKLESVKAGAQLAGSHASNKPPYSIHRCAPKVNNTQKMHFLAQKNAFWKTGSNQIIFFLDGLCRSCKNIWIEIAESEKNTQKG